MQSAYESWMASFPTVPTLWYTRVHVCAIDSSDVLTNIESLIDNPFRSIVWVLDINLYHGYDYGYIRFGGCFDDLRPWCQNDIFENIEFFDYFFN